MKIPYSWLKDFVDIKLAPEQLAEKLTMAGLEVKAVEFKGAEAVFEIEITSNRPDWLSIVGVAREIAALTGKKLKVNKGRAFSVIPAHKAAVAAGKLGVQIEDKKDCPLYTAKIIRDVKVGPSPQWLRQRLELVGCRSVNNVVDITNYVLFELGAPLHAFDLDKLFSAEDPANAIVVRRAKAQEEISTIDANKHSLTSEVLVIAAADGTTNKPVAVAGIMGGKDSEVAMSTQNIILEAAVFNPVVVRRGRQRLAMQSEASYRFERGVDVRVAQEASNRAAALIQKICSGKLCCQTNNGALKVKTKSILLDPCQVDKTIGIAIAPEKIKAILTNLGFVAASAAKKQLKVSIPSFRQDVVAPIDLIEEIARISGYQNIPNSLAKVTLQNRGRNDYHRQRQLKDILVGLGLWEVVTYSLIDRQLLKDFNVNDQDTVEISNPLSQEQEVLRPVLFPSLCRAIATNLRQQPALLRLFEVAKVYKMGPDNVYREPYHLGVAICGCKTAFTEDSSQILNDPMGLLHLKGIAQNIIEHMGFDLSLAGFVPDKTGQVELSFDGKALGFLRQIPADILLGLDIKNTDVFIMEIDLDTLFSLRVRDKKFIMFSRLPGMTRDISLVLDEAVSAQEVIKQIQLNAGDILQTATVTNFYKGNPIPAGYKNLTISCFYCCAQRTLSEEQVNTLHKRITTALVDKFKAQLR